MLILHCVSTLELHEKLSWEIKEKLGDTAYIEKLFNTKAIDTKIQFHWKAKDYSILHAAAEQGNLELVKYLIDTQKMSPHALDSEGGSILLYAVRSKNMDLFTYLADEKKVQIPTQPTKDYEMTLLSVAIGTYDFKIIKHMVNTYHLDVNQVAEERTPLMLVSKNLTEPDKTIVILDFLIKKGADVNKTVRGLRVLDVAYANKKIKRFLMSKGAKFISQG